MRHVDTIIKAKWIISVDQKNHVYEDHAVIIDHGKIIDIVANHLLNSHYSANITHFLDSHHALMPGLVNAHTHAPMNLMRGLADDLPLMSWLSHYIWPAERIAVSEQFVIDGTRHALCEMIRGGTTCINEFYFYGLEAAEVINKAGIRARIAETIFNFETPWSPKPEVAFKRTLDLIEAVKDYPLIEASVGPHSPYGTDLKIMQEVHSISKKHHIPIHMHLHETRDEIKQYHELHQTRPLTQYYEMGLCNSRFQAVHMTQLTPKDIEIVAKTGMHVIHCPESNMKLAAGMSPIQELINLGVNVALGTDGACSNNDLDMFSEMRSAAMTAKIRDHSPEAVPALTAIRMATINGAKALGLDNVTGSIEVKKSADLIAINLNHVSTQPVYNPISQIVYAASRDQVTDVWVAGKPLLRNKELTTINETAVFENILEWRERLYKLAKK